MPCLTPEIGKAADPINRYPIMLSPGEDAIFVGLLLSRMPLK